MRHNHTLESVLARGLYRINIPGTVEMPTLSETQRRKIHASFRLEDGLWHTFRLTDPVLAKERDAELDGPMLP